MGVHVLCTPGSVHASLHRCCKRRCMRGCPQVERYVFFPACAERFGTARPSLLDQGRDEDADHGMLAAALRVLLEVMHQLAYISCGLPEADVVLQLQAIGFLQPGPGHAAMAADCLMTLVLPKGMGCRCV